MDQALKEGKLHGTEEYRYTQYHCHCMPRILHTPVHWHDELELIYVRRGTLQINIDGQSYAGRSGSIFVVNPQQLHLMCSETLQVDYYTLLFPLEFLSFQTLDALEREVFLPLRTGQLLLAAEVPAALLQTGLAALLDRVTAVNEAASPFYQLETRVLLLEFFLRLLRAEPSLLQAGGARNEMQKRLLLYLQQHYQGRVSLDGLAAEFHLSPKYLSRYFRVHFRMTLSQYLCHLRLTHAQRLLETTDLPVTEIALQSGFSSVGLLIRQFKPVYGLSPLQYRKQQRQEQAV